jgi:hypothetical protein
MSIKSVDMQVLVQKVADIARIQQTQRTEASHRQGEFSQLINNQTIANRQTVRELSDPEAKTLEDRHNKKQEQEQSRDRHRSGNENPDGEQELFKDFFKGNTIDIKI